MCNNGVRKAKGQLELKLAREVRATRVVSQRCTVIGQEATDTDWNMVNSN